MATQTESKEARISSLIATWEDAKESLARAEREINSARCAMENAISALGKAVIPEAKSFAHEREDPKAVYCIIKADKVLEVRRQYRNAEGGEPVATGNFIVKWRGERE